MRKILNNNFGMPVIFEYVLDELLTIMVNRQPFEYVDKTLRTILNYINARSFEMITLSGEEHISKVIALFRKINGDPNRNKKLSFTDCAILFVMIENGIQYLSTFDSGFSGLLEKLEDGIYTLTERKKHELERILMT
ncbi:twitching motility protein PilT [Saccharolobus islandicus]|nr:twitching motility protein PilT [Sulfolobus islandicus]